MVKGWQGLADGALGCYACVLSFPPCGNGLFKALDSSFRWAATGILPSHRIQNFLSINDGGGFRLSPDGYRPPRPLVQDAALPPASLQGSLRWNDNGGCHHSGKSRHPATPSFRRRPESSGLHKPFPHSGNDNQRSDKPARHPPEPAIPSFLRPALLGGSFQTPLYHLHPCRRGFQPALE